MSLEKLGEAYFLPQMEINPETHNWSKCRGKNPGLTKEKNLQYLSFSDWLNFLNVIISSRIHFPANGMILFFFLAENFPLCNYNTFKKIHSTVKGHLDLVPNLCIVKSYSKYLWPNISCKVQRVPPAIPLHTKGQAHWLIQNWVLA